MRRFFACLFFMLILAGQGVLTLLIYYATGDGTIPPKLAMLLFIPVCIVTYWITLIFDAISADGKKRTFASPNGKTITIKKVILPKPVKKAMRTITTLWMFGIILVWLYYIARYSLWYMI